MTLVDVRVKIRARAVAPVPTFLASEPPPAHSLLNKYWIVPCCSRPGPIDPLQVAVLTPKLIDRTRNVLSSRDDLDRKTLPGTMTHRVSPGHASMVWSMRRADDRSHDPHLTIKE